MWTVGLSIVVALIVPLMVVYQLLIAVSFVPVAL